jgi:phytoene dehydrogenase-like protein
MTRDLYDAVVVGAGPNGLAAANILADAGLSVLVLEAKATIGGGARSAELTLPGFIHDICSAIHPFGVASPYFNTLNLDEYGLTWCEPDLAVAHPLEDGQVGTLARSVDVTCASLEEDAAAHRELVASFSDHYQSLFEQTLRPVRIPSKPLLMAKFGLLGLQSCEAFVKRHYSGPRARALFSGSAAHSMRSLSEPGTAAFGLMLTLAAHYVGWPCARGGSQSIITALERRLLERGGEIRTAHPVRALADIPESRAVLFDLVPADLARIAGDALPRDYTRKLRRYRHGPGMFKIDWALSEAIPWRAAPCRRAGTVHVGGQFERLLESEHAAVTGRVSDRPFVLVAQQSIFDDTRAPAGKHTGWGYCHVPHGYSGDMTEIVEQQIERFAPGFRDTILARHTINSAQLEEHNPNMIGGDIGGGANDISQFLLRPFPKWDPYSTPNPRLFLCSSASPPGGGVHGMCGYWAARSALSRVFGKTDSAMRP